MWHHEVQAALAGVAGTRRKLRLRRAGATVEVDVPTAELLGPATQNASTTPGAASFAVTDAAETDARNAAEAWLAGADSGKYAESWTLASKRFQTMLGQAEWVAKLTAVRTPLGALMSRTLRSSAYSTNLRGAPKGEYVVMKFDTSFENQPVAVETVTFTKDTSSEWRLSGYFIHR